MHAMPRDEATGEQRVNSDSADPVGRLQEELRRRDARIAELQSTLDGAVEHMREGARLLQDMAGSAKAFDDISAELLRQNVPAAALVRFGEIYYGLNALDDAQRLFARAVELDPANVDALNNIGVLHYGRGELTAAEQYFFAALEHDPRRRESRDNLQSLYTTYPEILAQPRPGGVACPCCGSHFPKFIPGGVNLRPNAMCPNCGSLERHRLMQLYFQSRTNLYTDRLKVLHFAPEACLELSLDNNSNIDYISADLYSPRAKQKVDITAIPYPDATFDVVLCSHVLEHIPDDRQAMRELRRVLKPDGWALLQVPIDKKRMVTFEDPTVTDPEERKRLFGQHDHVRWYGQDYPARLRECGFDVRIDRFMGELTADEVRSFGLGHGEEMHFCRRDPNWQGAVERNPAGVPGQPPSRPALPLPPQNLRFMNEDDAKFIRIGSDNLELMIEHGFTAQSRLLDIGSGYGRLPSAIIRDMDFQGRYVGVDILPRHIEWCAQNISSRHPDFQFGVMDVKNDRYNPQGRSLASEYRFPFDAGSFDYSVLFSVFTHMYELDIANYLRQIHRVLRLGGRCMATFFMFDEARLAAVTDPANALCMAHELNGYTRYHNAADPLHAIAFHRAFIIGLIEQTGFRVTLEHRGTWAGGSRCYQDVVVFEKCSETY